MAASASSAAYWTIGQPAEEPTLQRIEPRGGPPDARPTRKRAPNAPRMHHHPAPWSGRDSDVCAAVDRSDPRHDAAPTLLRAVPEPPTLLGRVRVEDAVDAGWVLTGSHEPPAQASSPPPVPRRNRDAAKSRPAPLDTELRLALVSRMVQEKLGIDDAAASRVLSERQIRAKLELDETDFAPDDIEQETAQASRPVMLPRPTPPKRKRRAPAPDEAWASPAAVAVAIPLPSPPRRRRVTPPPPAPLPAPGAAISIPFPKSPRKRATAVPSAPARLRLHPAQAQPRVTPLPPPPRPTARGRDRADGDELRRGRARRGPVRIGRAWCRRGDPTGGATARGVGHQCRLRARGRSRVRLRPRRAASTGAIPAGFGVPA